MSSSDQNKSNNQCDDDCAVADGEGERQTTAARLRESEERFRTLADNMSQLAWAWMAEPKGWIFC